jgi:hypothetical protein
MFPGDTSSISLFTFYAGGHIIDDKTNPIFFVGGSQHSVMAGVRIKFGDNSLFSQDRSGINTDMTFSALPVIDALYGVGELPDW